MKETSSSQSNNPLTDKDIALIKMFVETIFQELGANKLASANGYLTVLQSLKSLKTYTAEQVNEQINLALLEASGSNEKILSVAFLELFTKFHVNFAKDFLPPEIILDIATVIYNRGIKLIPTNVNIAKKIFKIALEYLHIVLVKDKESPLETGIRLKFNIAYGRCAFLLEEYKEAYNAFSSVLALVINNGISKEITSKIVSSNEIILFIKSDIYVDSNHLNHDMLTIIKGILPLVDIDDNLMEILTIFTNKLFVNKKLQEIIDLVEIIEKLHPRPGILLINKLETLITLKKYQQAYDYALSLLPLDHLKQNKHSYFNLLLQLTFACYTLNDISSAKQYNIEACNYLDSYDESLMHLYNNCIYYKIKDVSPIEQILLPKLAKYVTTDSRQQQTIELLQIACSIYTNKSKKTIISRLEEIANAIKPQPNDNFFAFANFILGQAYNAYGQHDKLLNRYWNIVYKNKITSVPIDREVANALNANPTSYHIETFINKLDTSPNAPIYQIYAGFRYSLIHKLFEMNNYEKVYDFLRKYCSQFLILSYCDLDQLLTLAQHTKADLNPIIETFEANFTNNKYLILYRLISELVNYKRDKADLTSNFQRFKSLNCDTRETQLYFNYMLNLVESMSPEVKVELMQFLISCEKKNIISTHLYFAQVWILHCLGNKDNTYINDINAAISKAFMQDPLYASSFYICMQASINPPAKNKISDKKPAPPQVRQEKPIELAIETTPLPIKSNPPIAANNVKITAVEIMHQLEPKTKIKSKTKASRCHSYKDISEVLKHVINPKIRHTILQEMKQKFANELIIPPLATQIVYVWEQFGVRYDTNSNRMKPKYFRYAERPYLFTMLSDSCYEALNKKERHHINAANGNNIILPNNSTGKNGFKIIRNSSGIEVLGELVIIGCNDRYNGVSVDVIYSCNDENNHDCNISMPLLILSNVDGHKAIKKKVRDATEPLIMQL